jgi:DNA polymerase bacteriophage-type
VPVRIVRDYETRCDISVVDVGAWKYVSHPSHEVLCVGWRVKRDATWGEPLVAIVQGGAEGRRAVERRVEEKEYRVATLEQYFADYDAADVHLAHNVGFEVATECARYPHLRPMERHWSCTAARSRRLGLPGSLGDACKVLRTPHQKSEAGHGIMLQVSQPRPVWRTNPSLPKFFDDAVRLAACAVYCVEDILAECDLDDYLPELPAQERLFWLQTERCNRRGIRLDARLIDVMAGVVERSGAAALSDVRRATGNQDFELTNVNSIKAFCAGRGVYLDDLRAATVASKLDAHRSGARRMDEAAAIVLEARQQSGGKSSNAKLATMRDRLMDDGRVRDLTIYHGAHTGRTTGSGINVLNLPRPYKGFDQDLVIDYLLRNDLVGLRREQGVSPAVAVSAALRGVIVPSAGRRFAVGDYLSIEPCCLFTLARQWDAVETLRAKKNIYIEFGKSFYGRELDKVKDVAQYTLCKGVILGAGYGLGEDNFVAKLQAEGVDLPENELRRAHASYRTRFSEVPRLWNGIGEAMKQAIRRTGTWQSYNDILFMSDGYWLVITLPSGRNLHYPNARLQPGKYGDEVVYEGWMKVDNRPAGWGDVRTWGARTVENLCQSICRDIMAEDELEVEALPGWAMAMTVYDELVAECPDELAPGEGKRILLSKMERSRPWFPMMPVIADGHEARRYSKG